MKNRNIVIHIIQILLIIFFTIAIVPKTFQNDTYFTISLGENIINEGISKEEKLVWHEGLEFTNPRWLFDVIIYLLNEKCGFIGIYIFVIIIAVIQSVLYYYILNKISKKKFLSFITSIGVIFVLQVEITARAQLISFLLFLIEFYSIEQLLETNKKRYMIILGILPYILCNIHASVFPMYFVIYLPYIAEFILSKINLKVDESSKILIQNRNIKSLVILIFIGILAGFCTPESVEPYTYIFKNIGGVSSAFIEELQALDIHGGLFMFCIIFISIAIISFTKTKIRVTDAFFILGFALISLNTYRSIFFFYLISTICTFRIINDFLDTYKIDLTFITKKKQLIGFIITYVCILLISINSFIIRLQEEYLDYAKYPIIATDYILNNVDIANMKLYNHFNFGSYLEYKGIKTFIDSRSEVYTEEFNSGTTIALDWLAITDGEKHYQDIFNKYEITHALLYATEIANIYIAEDSNWNLIYEDSNFALYERVEK